LIADAGLEEQLFPLARALDYLVTNDEAMIEKLSPEIKGVVKEIAEKLRNNNSKDSKSFAGDSGRSTMLAEKLRVSA
jgi:hypothetical protein